MRWRRCCDERLNGIALDHLDAFRGVARAMLPPGKMTVFDTSGAAADAAPALAGLEPLQRYVTCRDARLQAVLGDWLHEVYIVPDAAAGLDLREQLPAGALLVSRDGPRLHAS